MTAENAAYTHDRKQSGFSLTELLVTLAILLLVTSIMATGAPAALRAYMGVVDASNANILLTTTATRLRDELSMVNPDVSTMDPSTEGTEVERKSFVSLETGYQISFKWDDEGYLLKEEQSTVSSDDGDITKEQQKERQTLLVPKKFSSAAGSSEKMRATYDKITYDGNGVFTVHDLKVVKMTRITDGKPDGSVVGGAEYTDFKIRVLAAAG